MLVPSLFSSVKFNSTTSVGSGIQWVAADITLVDLEAPGAAQAAKKECTNGFELIRHVNDAVLRR